PRAVDGGMIEFDEELQLEAFVRFQPRPDFTVAAAVAHFDRFLDADEFLGGFLFLQTCLLQQEYEGRSGAVHDRHFFGRQVDVEIVDAQSGAGGHQVLDRRYLGHTLLQRGGHARVAHIGGARRQYDGRIEIDAPEHDAGIDRRRAQRQFDLGPGMQTDADGLDALFDGALFEHDRL